MRFWDDTKSTDLERSALSITHLHDFSSCNKLLQGGFSSFADSTFRLALRHSTTLSLKLIRILVYNRLECS